MGGQPSRGTAPVLPVRVSVRLPSGRPVLTDVELGPRDKISGLRRRAEACSGRHLAGLLARGSVLRDDATPEEAGLKDGDDITAVAGQQACVRARLQAFVALLGDGSIVTQGTGPTEPVRVVVGCDGSAAVWGDAHGGCRELARNVQAFAGVGLDGSVITWHRPGRRPGELRRQVLHRAGPLAGCTVAWVA